MIPREVLESMVLDLWARVFYKDGSKAMTGALTIADVTSPLKFAGGDFAFNTYATYLGLTNKAKSAFADLRVNMTLQQVIYTALTDSWFPYTDSNYYVRIESGKLWRFENAAKVLKASVDENGNFFTGDITVLDGKSVNLDGAGNMICTGVLAADDLTGSMRYNAAADIFAIYDGSAWKPH